MGRVGKVHPAQHMYDDRYAEWRENQRVEAQHVPFMAREGEGHREPEVFAQVAQAREETARSGRSVPPSSQRNAKAGLVTWLYGDLAVFRGLALDQSAGKLTTAQIAKKGKDLGAVEFAGVRTGVWWGPAEVGDENRAKPFTKHNFLTVKGKVIIIAHGFATSLTLKDGTAYSRERWPYQKDGFDWTKAKGNITELVLLTCSGCSEETMRKGMIEKTATHRIQRVNPTTLQREVIEEERSIRITPIARDMANGLGIPVTAAVGEVNTHVTPGRVGRNTQVWDDGFVKLSHEFKTAPAVALAGLVRRLGVLTSGEIRNRNLIGAWFDFWFEGKLIRIEPERTQESGGEK